MTQTQNNFGAFWPKRLNDHFLLQGAELFREGAFFRAHVYVPTAACIFINQRHASWILVVTCQVYHFLFSAFIFGKCCPDAAFTRSLSLRNFWCKAPEQCRERERCNLFRSPEAAAICIRLAPKVAAEQYFHRIVHSVRPFMHFFLCAHAYRTLHACDPKPRRRLHAMHVPAASQLGGRRTTSPALTSTHVRVFTYGEAEKTVFEQ